MIMVSACLVGMNCKYNGQNNYHSGVVRYLADKPYIAVCPEVMAGLSVPRPPCEIRRDDGKTRVVCENGEDVTEAFHQGARICLALAKLNGVDTAILKQRSPSCGCGKIYDGRFQSQLIAGSGITAALLQASRIQVLSEEEISALER